MLTLRVLTLVWLHLFAICSGFEVTENTHSLNITQTGHKSRLREEVLGLFNNSRRLGSEDVDNLSMTNAMRIMMGLNIDRLEYTGKEMTKEQCRPKYGKLRYFKEEEKRNPPML